MSIRSYFAVKQRDEPELEKVVPSSMAEAVKTEMKRATDAEGGSIERKRGAYEKIAPESKAKIAKYAAKHRHGEVTDHTPSLRHYRLSLVVLHASLSSQFRGSTTLLLYYIYSV